MSFDGPLAASAYEILGVTADVSDDDLRRAYRLRLRQTHPDTGGDAAVFLRVQHAWSLVGDAAARAAYDRGRGDQAWAGEPEARRGHTGTRPRGRSHGAAGAWRRATFEAMIAEHLGRAVTTAEAYDPLTVHAAPWMVRRLLADALAQEATAAAIDELGIGFTAWHDVIAGEGAETIDHVVLGPVGAYALMSEDFGGPVRFRQGEVIGKGVGEETPVADLVARVRVVSRAAGVRFRGAIVILPDEALDEPVTDLGSIRGVPVAVVRRSLLRTTLRRGLAGARPFGGNEAFDVRTRLTHALRLRTP